MKGLPDPRPTARDGRPHSPEELAYLWDAALPLAAEQFGNHAADLRPRRSSKELANAVERLVGRDTCTLTGRSRSNCLSPASRNTLFQGAAADGLLLARWGSVAGRVRARPGDP